MDSGHGCICSDIWIQDIGAHHVHTDRRRDLELNREGQSMSITDPNTEFTVDGVKRSLQWPNKIR